MWDRRETLIRDRADCKQISQTMSCFDASSLIGGDFLSVFESIDLGTSTVPLVSDQDDVGNDDRRLHQDNSISVARRKASRPKGVASFIRISQGSNPNDEALTQETSTESQKLPGFRSFLENAGRNFSLRSFFRKFLDEEPLKEMCSSSRMDALQHFIFFHVPAIATTIFLLSLYIKRFRWPPARPTDDELAALQFAAKIHETFILASLTDILLHRIRWGLLGKHGVTLGFVTSPFHMGFPLMYMFSWEFWAAALKSKTSRPFHIKNIVLIVILALLGVGASPFSAIAVIPRIGWWELPKWQHKNKIVPTISQTWCVRGDIYPIEVDSSFAERLKNVTGGEIGALSAEGVSRNPTTILSALELLLKDPPLIPILANLSVPTTTEKESARPISFSVGPDSRTSANSSYYAYATTPMNFVARAVHSDSLALSSLKPLVKSEAWKPSGTAKWKQPLVFVHCSRRPDVNLLNATQATFEFDFSYPESERVRFPINMSHFDGPFKDIMDKKEDLVDTDFFWTAPSFLDIQDGMPYPITNSILFGQGYKNRGFSRFDIDLCFVQAQWVEADVWVHKPSSFQIQSHLKIPPDRLMPSIENDLNNENIIIMKEEWLREIGITGTNTSFRNTAYHQAMDFCVDFPWAEKCMPTFLSLYLTDALSVMTRHENGSTTDPDTTVVRNLFLEHAYSYIFTDSRTIPLAFSGLLLHVIIALLHLLVTVCAKKPWYSPRWADFGQMLVLALRSTAPEGLRNVGAGVQSSETWKLAAFVREVGEEKQLEMIVGEEAAAVQGEDDDEAQRGQGLRIPQPGIKYG